MINSQVNKKFLQQDFNSFKNQTKPTSVANQAYLPQQAAFSQLSPMPVTIVPNIYDQKNARMKALSSLISVGISLGLLFVMPKILQKNLKSSFAFMGFDREKTGQEALSVWRKIDGAQKIEDLALPQALKDVASDIKYDIENPQALLNKGIEKASNSILLYGPPGTGKTTFAKAIARMFPNAKFADLDITQLGSKYVNESESRVRAAVDEICKYANTHKNEKVVVLIDEIDSIIMVDTAKHSATLLNEFKKCVNDKLNQCKNIITIGATNVDIDPTKAMQEGGRILDTAMLDRITYKIRVDKPTAQQIATTLARSYSKSKDKLLPTELRDADSAVLKDISEKLFKKGISFRDLGNFTTLAAHNDKASSSLKIQDLYAALDKLQVVDQKAPKARIAGFGG